MVLGHGTIRDMIKKTLKEDNYSKVSKEAVVYMVEVMTTFCGNVIRNSTKEMKLDKAKRKTLFRRDIEIALDCASNVVSNLPKVEYKDAVDSTTRDKEQDTKEIDKDIPSGDSDTLNIPEGDDL